MFLTDGSHPFKKAYRRYGLDFRYEKRKNRYSIKSIFQRIKHRTHILSNCFGDAEPETAEELDEAARDRIYRNGSSSSPSTDGQSDDGEGSRRVVELESERGR